jgi:hypothetical protein
LQHGTSAAGVMWESSAAKGLEQMGVGLAILMETTVTDDCHPRLMSGYKILASKAANHNQGGVTLLWKENCGDYEVELARIATPDLVTFQLVTGDKRFDCMGVYIPPTDTKGVEDLRAAWEPCPASCTPLILGDLNINFSESQNKREVLIVDKEVRSSTTTQTINQGTVDLVAQEGGEDASLSTRSYSCKGRGHAAIEGCQFLVAVIS